MLIFLLILTFLAFSINAYALPTFEEVKSSYKKSDVYLLDRNGEIIHELRIDHKIRRLEWVDLKDISPSLIKAVIKLEDKNFYEHSGVDWKALGSAFIENILGEKSRGASTITMQLVSLLDKNLKPKGKKRTLSQKIEQIKAALELEKSWTKEHILEAYLNLVSFRGELQGIASASQGLFGKEPSGLTEIESLLLASLIPSPNSLIEKIEKRACLLSESLKWNIKCDEIKVLAQSSIYRPYHIKHTVSLAPHVARRLIRENKDVKSTLDKKLQIFALQTLRHHLNQLRAQNVNDGAVLIVDNKTGEILAYIGNSGTNPSTIHVDGVLAKRQAGSTLKPFLYGLAIEKRLITAASLIEDTPLNVTTERGIYSPKNYDNEYRGLVTVRTALASSINIPAVRVLMLLGEENFALRLRELGFEGVKDGEYYGPSMALGTVDVSLYELVNAYRTLANRGKWSSLTLTFDRTALKQRKVMEEDTTFIVSHILSDREARSETFGFENPISTKFWTAVKTGTSKDMRDNWCIGFSEKYTVGVWVGNFIGTPMKNVSGVSGAAPIWLEIMNYLHSNIPSRQANPPKTVVKKRVLLNDDSKAEKEEYFLKGTEIEHVLTLKDRGQDSPKIVYPSSDTIIAIDPDIPEENQYVTLSYKPLTEKYEWLINGEKTGIKTPQFLWQTKPGSYRISIVDSENKLIDSVEFIVK
ncbi:MULTISPECIES: penicillin-binding protein 1C [Thermodesulfovibrio]|jgi:penicillin-binding protein 1C|uniref:penicillin-binding protein 1C n=1 Tax=Thermodesulfovibrio TaxID=28261 RepID=UPI002618F5BA|nr:penicillin-binding protein 1C [Thermodesulfovibrio sp.]